MIKEFVKLAKKLLAPDGACRKTLENPRLFEFAGKKYYLQSYSINSNGSLDFSLMELK